MSTIKFPYLQEIAFLSLFWERWQCWVEPILKDWERLRIIRLYHWIYISVYSRHHKNKTLWYILTFVLNEFLTAHKFVYKKKYFWNECHESWYIPSSRFFWHLLRPDRPIIRGMVSLWRILEHWQIVVFEGKCRRFRVLLNVQRLKNSLLFCF